MGETLYSLIWCALTVWTCVQPDGYGPYVLLGCNLGDLATAMYFGFGDGYLRTEGDFTLDRFLLNALAIALLTAFCWGGVAFQPGSDAYDNAVILVFFSGCGAFVFRYIQYSAVRLGL